MKTILRNQGRDSASRGFTLIEALLVIVIAGLISAFAIPRMAAIVTGARLDRAAQVLGSSMQAAFGLAMRNRKPMQIAFDTSKVQLTISDRAGNVYTRTGLDAFGLKKSNVTLSRPILEVYPEGLAQDSLSITLSSVTTGTTLSRQVRMTRGGLVQVR